MYNGRGINKGDWKRVLIERSKTGSWYSRERKRRVLRKRECTAISTVKYLCEYKQTQTWKHEWFSKTKKFDDLLGFQWNGEGGIHYQSFCKSLFSTMSSAVLPTPSWLAINHHINTFCTFASSTCNFLIIVQIWRDSVKKC